VDSRWECEVHKAVTSFRDLLKPDPRSTPAEEQGRASAGLADAVKRSNLRWWRSREPVLGQESYLVLAVAPYSQYDLTLLDLLDEKLSASPAVPVYVVNLQDYETPERLGADFPGVGQFHQTPIAALYEAGSLTNVAWGKKARDMAAEAVGFSPDELSRRVVAESPNYANSPRSARVS
jgi:hypothetical protein